MSVFFYYLTLQCRPFVQALMSDEHPVFTYWMTDSFLLEGIIILYAFTIVYGRLYSGMHSVLGTLGHLVQMANCVDCFVGSCIGLFVALFCIWIDPMLGDFLLSGSVWGVYR